MIFTLTPPAPYAFAHTMFAARFLYIAARPMPDGAIRRAVRVGDRLALLELRDRGTVDMPRIEVRLLASDGAIDPDRLQPKASALLNARVDLAAFYAAHGTDAHIAPTTARLRGLHALGADTLFEAVALTMIEQQITVKMAQTSERWLMEWVGDGLDYQGARYPVFPTPARIADCTVEQLIPMKITRIRMGRLIAFARAIADDADGFERLRLAPTETLYSTLRAFSGVGHWTAAWSMIRAVGAFPYFGAADVALRNAVNRLCFDAPGRAEPAAMDALFARYGDYAGLASYYLMMHYEFDRYNSSHA
ncbi:MAG: hypothetical protein SGJ24_04915 [Chloroflexota bacterium]|nr:hypothetical protein [Chloroflexota bacterium]